MNHLGCIGIPGDLEAGYPTSAAIEIRRTAIKIYSGSIGIGEDFSNGGNSEAGNTKRNSFCQWSGAPLCRAYLKEPCEIIWRRSEIT